MTISLTPKFAFKQQKFTFNDITFKIVPINSNVYPILIKQVLKMETLKTNGELLLKSIYIWRAVWSKIKSV